MIARLNVGGAALHVLQLAHEQQRRGHDVIVVTGTLAAGEESMEYVADELAVTVRKVPALQRELSLRADAAAILAIRRILLEAKLDVLHTHTSKAGATGRIAALVAGNNRPRSVVHTYHGHVLRGYFDARRERVFRLAERVLARSADVLIAVSDQSVTTSLHSASRPQRASRSCRTGSICRRGATPTTRRALASARSWGSTTERSWSAGRGG